MGVKRSIKNQKSFKEVVSEKKNQNKSIISIDSVQDEQTFLKI